MADDRNEPGGLGVFSRPEPRIHRVVIRQPGGPPAPKLPDIRVTPLSRTLSSGRRIHPANLVLTGSFLIVLIGVLTFGLTQLVRSDQTGVLGRTQMRPAAAAGTGSTTIAATTKPDTLNRDTVTTTASSTSAPVVNLPSVASGRPPATQAGAELLVTVEPTTTTTKPTKPTTTTTTTKPTTTTTTTTTESTTTLPVVTTEPATTTTRLRSTLPPETATSTTAGLTTTQPTTTQPSTTQTATEQSSSTVPIPTAAPSTTTGEDEPGGQDDP